MSDLWKPLLDAQSAVKDRPILDLFRADPQRAQAFSSRAGDMLLDYSKTNIDAGAKAALIGKCKLKGRSG